MASVPIAKLTFEDSCADCGTREVTLPERLPDIGDDFDWQLRDYDGFRLFMLEELAARFPERRRWTPADMEVVIVETLSVVLDQFSDMLDRVHAEAFLETARNPVSVRRLLAMIGYDAVAQAASAAGIPDAVLPGIETEAEKRERLRDFHKALLLILDDYQSIVDNELSAAEQDGLLAFIDDPDAATLSALNAVQSFLNNAPEFVQRARNMALERYWARYPNMMDAARGAGPRAVHTQKRMVTEGDYAERMEDHPLVMRGFASSRWTGSWITLRVAVVIRANILLDIPLNAASVGGADALASLRDQVDAFHTERGIDLPEWPADPSTRTVLRPYLDAYRLAGQEVFLQDAEFVGVNISLSVRVADNYFQSEVRRAVLDSLGTGLGGFFEPGRLQFGEDLHTSDVIEVVMALDGVEAVCVNRFKRVGSRYPDQSDAGRIVLEDLKIAVCNNDPAAPQFGLLRVSMHGGRRG